MFIDSHCHLNFSAFDEDLDAVVHRAVEAGVDRIIVASVDEESSRKAVELAERTPQIYAAVGIHPQDAQKYAEESIRIFQDWARHPKVVAIGEIGLDYYRDYNPKELQVRVFKRFVRLAKETGLPIIVHNRGADSDVMAVLSDPRFKSVTGVFHCFSSDLSYARNVLQRGYLISFTGIVTFKNSESAAILRELPEEKLMLETDAPLLAPEPHRGKRNEPAFIKFVAEKFAEVKQISLDEIAKITTQNALRLFPKLRNAFD
ncbi:putative deoxyribonuclease YcfH [bacterium BMS3Abin05]|nr:putative deoxyribonuclease YcfH [bacterium BMS3Abin05]GBE28445.1 putative deoxyribonuclease YcfH [bacterium BMS3Bbin03]